MGIACNCVLGPPATIPIAITPVPNKFHESLSADACVFSCFRTCSIPSSTQWDRVAVVSFVGYRKSSLANPGGIYFYDNAVSRPLSERSPENCVRCQTSGNCRQPARISTPGVHISSHGRDVDSNPRSCGLTFRVELRCSRARRRRLHREVSPALRSTLLIRGDHVLITHTQFGPHGAATVSG